MTKTKPSIVVLGDTILDIYQYGEVKRISPEFSIPILLSTDSQKEQCPGGAGNVCFQMKHFNVNGFLISLLDDDSYNVYKNKLNIDLCIRHPNACIPKKIRFYDNNFFPLHRWDIEKPFCGLSTDEINKFRNLVYENFVTLAKSTNIDVLTISDYNKFFWTDSLAQKIIDFCNSQKIITIVDPKKSLHLWKNCTYLKPNSEEAKLLTNETDVEKQIEFLQKTLNCKGVVVTQGGDGILGKESNYFCHKGSRSNPIEVASVVGAGDAYLAILAIYLSRGFTFEESCKIAFEGGAEYVKAKHNRPITPYELHRRIDPLHAKIVDLNDILYLRNGVYSDQRWIIANGVFDLLHGGHLMTLQQAKKRGDKLIVAVNSDQSVKTLKGEQRPILPLEERMEILAALECVDFVISFDESTPHNLVKTIKPHVMVKGSDWQDKTVAGSEYTEVHFVTKVEGLSTTNIIEKIRKL